MKYILLALTLSLGAVTQANAAATTQALFVLGNDHDASVEFVGVSVDSGLPVGFLSAPNNQGDRGQFYNLNDVAQPNGVSIMSGQGHDVIFLQGQLDRMGQGRFHLRYLANGLTNKYSTCDFLLQKSGDTFFAQNAYTGARITNPKVITWALGLRTLQGICQ